MRRIAMGLVLGWIAAGSCAASLKKLSQDELDAYHALQPFLSDDQEKALLKLKTPEERAEYLKSQKLAMGAQTADNLHELWYRFDADTRAAVTEGRVEKGWTQDMMFMAWGEPVNRQRLTGRPATRSELFNYRFEILEDGSTLVWVPKSKASYKSVDRYQVDVYVDDGRVTELVRKAEWD